MYKVLTFQLAKTIEKDRLFYAWIVVSHEPCNPFGYDSVPPSQRRGTVRCTKLCNVYQLLSRSTLTTRLLGCLATLGERAIGITTLLGTSGCRSGLRRGNIHDTARAVQTTFVPGFGSGFAALREGAVGVAA